MIAQGLKHFLVVGLVFALAVGWALTLAVNTLLGNALGAALHFKDGGEPYWLALLLTIVSMTLITVATIVGSRVFRRHVEANGITARSLALSSLLFVGVVLVFVVPELADLMNRFMTHMSYTYEHSGEAWLMLSLPLLRLVGLPLAYIIIGRRQLLPPRSVSTTLAAA